MWYFTGRTRKTSRVAGPGPSIHKIDRRRSTTDKGSYSLGDSSACYALRYARRARTGTSLVKGDGFRESGIEVTQ
jgi:hypothetical protein